MIVIPYHVASDGYTCVPGVNPNVVTNLPGGFPRFERDLLEVWFSFTVSFELRARHYEDMCNKYAQHLRTLEPLQVRLASLSVVKPHQCWVQPGTWRLEQTEARDYFRVGMTLLGAEL